MSTLYKKYGDMGDIAEHKFFKGSLFGMKSKQLTIGGIFKQLVAISKLSGSGSQKKSKKLMCVSILFFQFIKTCYLCKKTSILRLTPLTFF